MVSGIAVARLCETVSVEVEYFAVQVTAALAVQLAHKTAGVTRAARLAAMLELFTNPLQPWLQRQPKVTSFPHRLNIDLAWSLRTKRNKMAADLELTSY